LVVGVVVALAVVVLVVLVFVMVAVDVVAGLVRSPSRGADVVVARLALLLLALATTVVVVGAALRLAAIVVLSSPGLLALGSPATSGLLVLALAADAGLGSSERRATKAPALIATATSPTVKTATRRDLLGGADATEVPVNVGVGLVGSTRPWPVAAAAAPCSASSGEACKAVLSVAGSTGW